METNEQKLANNIILSAVKGKNRGKIIEKIREMGRRLLKRSSHFLTIPVEDWILLQ
jgi:hypothetical protein